MHTLQYIEHTTARVDSHPFVRGAAWYITRGLVASLVSCMGVVCGRSFFTQFPRHRSTPGLGLLEGGGGEQSAALILNPPGLYRDSFPLFTVYTHCQVFVQGINLKIPRVSSKLKHQDLSRGYIASGCLNSHKGHKWCYCTALVLSCWFALVSGRSL